MGGILSILCDEEVRGFSIDGGIDCVGGTCTSRCIVQGYSGCGESRSIPHATVAIEW